MHSDDYYSGEEIGFDGDSEQELDDSFQSAQDDEDDQLLEENEQDQN